MYNHTAIPVVDLQESQEFYEILGLTKFREWKKPEQDLHAIVMKTTSGFILELVYSPTNQVLLPSPVFAAYHIELSVPNLDLLLTSLQDIGITILQEATEGVSVKEFAFVENPSGNVVELVVEH